MMDRVHPFPILDPSEAHLPLVILIDNSPNMNKDRLAFLNDSLNIFIEAIRKDEYRTRTVDILRINIYNSIPVMPKFIPACMQKSEQTKVENSICVSYDLLNETIREQERLYRRCGVPCYKVQILFITSGQGYADSKDILNVSNLCGSLKHRVILIGTDECTPDTFKDVSSSKIILLNNNFIECFNWIKNEYFNEIFYPFAFEMNGGYSYVPESLMIIKDS